MSGAEEGRVVDPSDPAARALAELHSRLGDGAHTQLLVTDGTHWTAVKINEGRGVDQEGSTARTTDQGDSTMTEQPVEHIAQYFAYSHLPAHLQEVSRPFSEMAERILALPRNPERTVALRKLLESKDAAVRAALAK